jgi:hypothetical protein
MAMATLLFEIVMIALLPAFSILVDFAGVICARFKRYSIFGVSDDDFTLLVPIYGDVKYLENVEYLRQYGEKVVLCTTGEETQEFYQQLQEIAVKNGFRIFRDERDSSRSIQKANQPRATSGTIRDRLIRNALLNVVSTKYVVPIDADTTTSMPIHLLVGELAHQGWDIASIKLVLSNRDESVLTKLQYHEYDMAMQLRFIAPWMISGACHVAKAEVLRDVMSRHSLFFQGNDVEMGLIAKALGYKVGFIPFEVLTAVPSTKTGWWRQRLAWSGGEFRLFIINFKFVLSHPFWWLYGGMISIALFPLRWYYIIDLPIVFLAIFSIYYVLVVALHHRTMDRWVFVMPLYGLFSSLILTPLGVIWYFMMAKKDNNYGYIRPHRKPKEVDILEDVYGA